MGLLHDLTLWECAESIFRCALSPPACCRIPHMAEAGNPKARSETLAQTTSASLKLNATLVRFLLKAANRKYVFGPTKHKRLPMFAGMVTLCEQPKLALMNGIPNESRHFHVECGLHITH